MAMIIKEKMKMKALLWKEWREYKWLTITGILLVLLAYGSLLLNASGFDYVARNLDIYSMTALICFLVLFSILGIVPFSGELAQKNKSYLLSKPVGIKEIFRIKYLFGILVLTVLLTFTYLLFFSIMKYIPPSSPSASPLWYSYMTYMITGYFLFTAMFFTYFLVEDSFMSILLTPFIILLTSLILLPFIIVWYTIFIMLLDVSLMIGISNYCIWNYTLFFLVLIFIFLSSSYLVWKNAISRDKNMTKTLLAVLAVLLIGSWGSHGMFYAYTSIRLHNMIAEAGKTGLRLDVPDKIELNENDRKASKLFRQAFQLRKDIVAHTIPTFKKNKEGHVIDAHPIFPILKKRKESHVLQVDKDKDADLKNIYLDDSMKLYALIKEAISLPSCKLDVNPKAPDSDFIALRELSNWCLSRSNILYDAGKFPEAFDSALTSFKLGDAYPEIPIRGRTYWRNAMQVESINAILKIVPDAAYVDTYNLMINTMNKIKDNEYARDDASEFMKRLKNGEFNIFLFLYDFHSGNSSYGYGYSYSSTYSNNFFSYLGKPLYKLKAADCLRDILGQFHNWKHADYSFLFLGLNIYKAKYGAYPDNLSGLVPEIFPQLPPSCSNVKYVKIDDGFFLGFCQRGKYYSCQLAPAQAQEIAPAPFNMLEKKNNNDNSGGK